MEESIKGNKCERERERERSSSCILYIDHITVGRSCQTTSPNLEPQLRAKNVHIKRVKNISVLNFILCVFLEATKQARNRNRIRKKDQRTNERTGRQTDSQIGRWKDGQIDRQQAKLVLLLKEKKFAWKEREKEKKKVTHGWQSP